MSYSLAHREHRRLRAREKAKENSVRKNSWNRGHSSGSVAGRPIPENPFERMNLFAALLGIRKYFKRRLTNVK